MTKPRSNRALAANVLILALLLPAGVRGAQTQLVTWKQVSSPNRGTLQNTLYGISAVSSSDAWAVGEWNPGVPPTVTGRRTLAMHWNGSSWQTVRTPNPAWSGLDYATLQDVVALSASDVWAVGYSEDFASFRSNTLIMHWDGTAWSLVPSPNPAGKTLPNRLYAVAAVSASDIWAVGWTGLSPEQPLILQWSGTRWRVVPNGCTAGLQGVGVLSADDIWAVGDSMTCHFDGQTWQTVPSPQPRPQYWEIAYPLQDVSGTSMNDVWAVGARILDYGEYETWATLIEHWDGSAWTAFYEPGQRMNGVEAVSPNDVWAVGTTGSVAQILHWDGSWSQVSAPAPGNGSRLFDVAPAGAGGLWAAGEYFTAAGTNRTFTVHGVEP